MAQRTVIVSLAALAALTFGMAIACTPSEDDAAQFRGNFTPKPSAWVPAPLPEAHCEILVEAVGVKDMETDYLPHVVACENGGANFEALKAQAVAARSVAYYYIGNQGSVCDSQGCQVYTCQNQPSAEVYQAVAETSGMYLNYNEVLTYAFYVAGDPNTSAPACVGNPDVGTEHWVTYNESQSGANVEQTALGWVFQPNESGFGQNRGCMSQWGARCLENNNGYGYEQILRFYYGEDTLITQAQGECVEELGDGDGDQGDGDPGDGDPGDGDWGDGDQGDGDGDTPEECNIGALGCLCTMGGGCDPGLVCEEGTCVPDGDSDEGESDGDGLSGGFPADAFASDEGCACSATPTPARGHAWGALGLLGLLGLGRRRQTTARR